MTNKTLYLCTHIALTFVTSFIYYIEKRYHKAFIMFGVRKQCGKKGFASGVGYVSSVYVNRRAASATRMK